jgi:phosphoribosylamine--glycine ligase
VWHNGSVAVSVVAASGGYPGTFKKGFKISGLNSVEGDNIVFHAGTKIADNKTVTTGGRVLAITSVDKSGNLSAAISSVYDSLKRIAFTDIYYRNDIGHKALKHS